MSYSLSRDTIICSSSTELDCLGLRDRRSQDELWLSVCVSGYIQVRQRKTKGFHNSYLNFAKMHGCNDDLRSCGCVRTCTEMQASKSVSDQSAHSFSLSLQIQYHSATANFRYSPSRMQRQPISIEQTEIGNSLPCIDPVTLRLGTQH